MSTGQVSGEGGLKEIRQRVSKACDEVRNAFLSKKPQLPHSENILKQLTTARNKMKAGLEGIKSAVFSVPEKVAKAKCRLLETAVGQALDEKCRELKEDVSKRISKSLNIGVLNKIHTVGKGFKTKVSVKLFPEQEPPDPEEGGLQLAADSKTERQKMLERQHNRDGEILTYDYGEFCVEKAKAQPTKTLAIRSLEERKKAIETALAMLGPDAEKRPKLEAQLKTCDEGLEWEQNRKYEYIASGDHRLDDVDNPLDAGKLHSSELVNVYVQHAEVKGNKVFSLVRAGAIYDESCGLVDLKEIKAAKRLEKLTKLQSQLSEVRCKTPKDEAGIRLLENEIKEAQSQVDEKDIDIVRSARDKLNGIETKLLSSKSFIFHGRRYRALQHARRLLSTPTDEEIIMHETYLEQKMLQLVYFHLQEHASEIRKGEPFTFMQIGLQSPSTNKVEETGFGRSEPSNMRDVHEAFELMYDREVRFKEDVRVPYLDAEGIVYMPKVVGLPEDVETIELQPLFCNIAVQNFRNKDLHIQSELNQKLLDTLQEIIHQRMKLAKNNELYEANDLLHVCRERLKDGKSSFYIAEDLGMVAYKLGIPLGVNCLSAKDRTTFLATRLMVRVFIDKVAKNPNDLKRLKRKWGAIGIDPKVVGAQIAGKNNLSIINIIQVGAVFLPGIETPNHVVRRIYHLAELGLIRVTGKAQV